MKILNLCICTFFLLSGFASSALAAEDKRHSGVETSAEQKSEEGLEHGKDYAGSQEKGSAEEKRHSGVETSTEQKSEEGLEHGKSYAGSKEKKVKDPNAEAEEESGDDGKDKSKTEKSGKGKKSK